MFRYAITNRIEFAEDEPGRRAALLETAGRWAADGLDILQLREKDLEAGSLADLARELLGVLRMRTPAPKLLINSRADVAVAVGADGVHLTAQPGGLTPGQIRQLYSVAGLPEPVVSVSCHTLPEVAAARATGASYILFGPVFEKRVDDEVVAQGIGLNLLRSVCAAAAPTPVLALGGITNENTEACLTAGAAGIAAIRLFAAADTANIMEPDR